MRSERAKRASVTTSDGASRSLFYILENWIEYLSVRFFGPFSSGNYSEINSEKSVSTMKPCDIRTLARTESVFVEKNFEIYVK